MTASLPINFRILLVVVAFMIAVSAFTSERVLSRLDETQTRHVRSLSDVYLDGLSIALVDAMVREDIWQVFDVLDRSLRRPADLRPLETIVTTADGTVIASSDPIRVPSQARMPDEYQGALGDGINLAAPIGAKVAYSKRRVVYEGRPIGSIYAKVDISDRGAVHSHERPRRFRPQRMQATRSDLLAHLGVSRTTLWEKMRRYGLTSSESGA